MMLRGLNTQSFRRPRRSATLLFSSLYRCIVLIILCLAPEKVRANEVALLVEFSEMEGTLVASDRQKPLEWQAEAREVGGRRSLMARPGSTPVQCNAKCQGCSPCRAVQVPIQTADQPWIASEYYPEAWRCECKGKLYMP